ncbi:hypothetical protein CYY_005261 [Polysphondylium violaceum]|uniref:Pre-mRNA processing factor 4 (PRP4)-like domain-containing protein n=1 Tax=Polysphondylium violaceum TaxID=133409 RepID=A0A8J4PS15_9MYCE|nr:hypothetical protein CYY_005261 [Polysphondylium violaceum]
MNSNKIFYGQVKREDVNNNNSQKQQQHNDEQEDVEQQPQHEEFLPFSKHAKRSQSKFQEKLDDHENKKKSKLVIVPTNDNLVKLKLRELGEPIILFGEKYEDRRSRLRTLMIERNIYDGTPLAEKKRLEELEKQAYVHLNQEAFLTEGTEQLKQARIKISLYSLARANERLDSMKKIREKEVEINQININIKEEEKKQLLLKQQQQQQQQHQDESTDGTGNGSNGNGTASTDIKMIGEGGYNIQDKLVKTDFEKEYDGCVDKLKNYYPYFSQIADERPIAMSVFSPSAKYIASASWSGISKLWNENGEHMVTYTGHSQRVSSVAFHPQSGVTASMSSVNMATSSADSTIKLWNLESNLPIGSLDGHLDVVNRVAFHPSGQYLLSTSTDKSWRLWDLETNTTLLDQEGHAESVMGLAIQCDGSLVATGGLDSLVRIWDLRSGRPIHYFKGHNKQVISIDWSPNGYQLASASEDNTVMVWDMRKKENIFQILAHSSIVSCVKYSKTNVGFLTSCSFDAKIKTWSPIDWKPISTLEGHSSKVTSIDISTDNRIISSSFDKTWKLWAHDR